MGVNRSQLHVIVMLNICLHGISGDKYVHVYYDCRLLQQINNILCLLRVLNYWKNLDMLSALVSWDGLTQSFINKSKQDCSLVSGPAHDG